MTAQITALSQIQAQAIVHARKSQGTPQQIQTQIQLQAQALVHAHTQVRKTVSLVGSSHLFLPRGRLFH